MPKTPKYARVIFDLPFERQFHYLIPEGLKGKAAVGKRVTAPFGKKILPGFIVGVDEKTVIPQKKIKTVLEVLDDEPLVNQEMLRLTRWLSGYYFCPWGKALFEAVPAAVKQGKPKGKEKKVFSSLIKAAKSKFIPTKEQSQALRLITNYLEKGASDVILLFGNLRDQNNGLFTHLQAKINPLKINLGLSASLLSKKQYYIRSTFL